jgi:predicted transposase YdaD
LHGKIYGGYTEFKEETMNIPQRMRLIERHFSEMDEMRRSREDTARNILRLGLSVEQVTQATGLPRETVQALASQVSRE